MFLCHWFDLNESSYCQELYFHPCLLIEVASNKLHTTFHLVQVHKFIAITADC